MGTHSQRTLYRFRRPLLIMALIAPVVLLGLTWWIVTQVLMAPAVPTVKTPAVDVARFIQHPKGLPRLDTSEFEAFLEIQLARLRDNASFRERFLAELRIMSRDEVEQFNEHLFDAMKPLVMRDVRRFHELDPADRQVYLDDRIIEYNRINAAWGDTRISKGMLGPAAMSPQQTLDLLLRKTTEEERQRALAYGAAIHARVEEILADPQLEKQIRAEIAGGDSP